MTLAVTATMRESRDETQRGIILHPREIGALIDFGGIHDPGENRFDAAALALGFQ